MRDARFFAVSVVVPAALGVGSIWAVAAAADSSMVALITAVPPTIAALFAGVLGWLNHRQGSKIHVLVNSNMTAVKTDLALANDRIEKLQRLVAELSALKPPPPELMAPIPPTPPKL